jgi:hypothetical protein
VPLTIDLAGDYPLAEEVAAASGRLETTSPLGAVLDRLLQREPSPSLIPFDGALGLTIPGGPQRLEPGTSRTVPVTLKLPKGLSPTARYHAFAPLYASDLHIVIVTAAKPPPAVPRARRTKGTAA